MVFLFCGLGMGFHKPKPFVDAAGDFGEQIRRVGIVQFVRLIDRAAGFLSEGGKRAGNGFDMRHALRDGPSGYSSSCERDAATRAVPSAMPPSCTMRSAIMSTYDSTASSTLSKSSCRPMKLGPLTFQCACFICICRSTADASRWFMSAFKLRPALERDVVFGFIHFGGFRDGAVQSLHKIVIPSFLVWWLVLLYVWL
jgi:hypothetical protein